MRSGREDEAVEAADRALAIAERTNLEDIVAEALVNKGSALSRLGRRREAVALHELALRLAESRDLVALQLRTMNNLATALSEDDPMAALSMVQDGVVLARKVGNRGMSGWLVGTWAMNTYLHGEGWAQALTWLDEEIAAADGVDYRLLDVRLVLLAARGEAGLEALDASEERARSDPDPAGVAGATWVRALGEVALGRYEPAYRSAIRSTELADMFLDLAPQIAMRAALWARDIERARSAARLVEQMPSTGRVGQAYRAWARAASAALEGHPDAVDRLRAAIADYRATGLGFEAALAVLDAVALLPGDPEVATWVPEARQLLAREGAAPYLARLDALVSEARIDAPPPRAVGAPLAGAGGQAVGGSPG
jgi:tetratricopeptide (TPR) repeat protein